MNGTSVKPFLQSRSGYGDETLRSSQLCDPTAWVDKYGDCLLRFALSHVRHKQTAEDLVQETFLAALRSQNSFAGESSEKTWLIGILKHKIIDYVRVNKRQTIFSEFAGAQSDESEFVEAVIGEAPSPGQLVCLERPHADAATEEWRINPSHCAQQKAFWDVLHQCLSKLSPRLAAAFALREIEQLDTKEICENLNVSEGNLWVMLHRARRCLRVCIECNWLNKAA
jgi:RNA polymerase sigma-70 factor (ECF subfamily)